MDLMLKTQGCGWCKGSLCSTLVKTQLCANREFCNNSLVALELVCVWMRVWIRRQWRLAKG